MTTAKMSPLRQRMVEHMQIRGLEALVDFLGRAPNPATPPCNGRRHGNSRRQGQRLSPPFGKSPSNHGSTPAPTAEHPQDPISRMSLQELAYNMKRMINIFGVKPPMQAIAA